MNTPAPSLQNQESPRLFGSLLFRQVIAFLFNMSVPLALFWFAEYNGRRALDLEISKERIIQQGRFVEETFRGKVLSPMQRDLKLLAENPTVDEIFLASDSVRLLKLSDLEKLFQRTVAEVPNAASLSFINSTGQEEALVEDGHRSKNYRDLFSTAPKDEPLWHQHASRLFERLRGTAPLTIDAEGPFQLPDGSVYLIVGISRIDSVASFGGMIQLTYRLNTVLSDLASVAFREVPTVWVFDEEGNVYLGPPQDKPQVDPRKLLANLDADTITTTENATMYHCRLQLANREPFIAVISAPIEVYQENVRATGQRFLLILLLSAAISFVVALVSSRVLVQPISKLSKATQEIAQGNLSLDIIKDESGLRAPSEIELLRDNFASLVTKLRQIPEGLSQALTEMNRSMDVLGRSVHQQYQSLEAQASSLNEVGAVTHQIEQVSKLTDEKMQTVLVVTEKVDTLSARGQEAVNESLTGVESIRKQVDAIHTQISSLAAGTAKAGEIIETVKDLADQTNILALNAAIQAAKAGESARGFDVVAREMRSLANQSIKSAVRIRDILLETQDSIRATVELTKQGAREIEKSVEQIRESGLSLREMTGITQQSSTAARQIVAASSQQGAGIRQIYQGVRELNDSMQKALSAVKNTETSVEELRGANKRATEIVSSFKL
jgi:methyl-accepting chemotaxis protein